MRLEHRFEIFHRHNTHDRATFAKLRADTDYTLIEEDFFIDGKGKRRHPAHRKRFSNEAFLMVLVGQLPLVPGFSSLEDYDRYMFSYDEFYKSSIQRKVQSADKEEAEAEAKEIVGATADNANDKNEEALVIEEVEQLEPLVSQSPPCPPCHRGPEISREQNWNIRSVQPHLPFSGAEMQGECSLFEIA